MADQSQNVRQEELKDSLDVDFAHPDTAVERKTEEINERDVSSFDVVATEETAPLAEFSSSLKETCVDIELESLTVTPESGTLPHSADPYQTLTTPEEVSNTISTTSQRDPSEPVPVESKSESFQYRTRMPYNGTILDRLISYLAAMLERVDFIFTRKASKALMKKKQARLQREAELEEFMNERAKEAIGRKFAAKSKKKTEAEIDEEPDVDDED